MHLHRTSPLRILLPVTISLAALAWAPPGAVPGDGIRAEWPSLHERGEAAGARVPGDRSAHRVVDGTDEPPARLVEEARAVIRQTAAVRWTTVASLLGDGTASCIDGRAVRPVLGTPGGDVGEILVGLAALERTAKQRLRLAHLDALFETYVASFGLLYMHTDEHAMARLGKAIHADPRFRGFVVDEDAHALAARILAAPPALHPALLELLTKPEHIGCAHLRAAAQEPAKYGTRVEVVRAVFGSAFRLAWRNRTAVDWVVLEGEHRERGILEVHLDHQVHAHSRVPMIAPHDDTREFFVHHPDVAAFVRRENGTFFLEHGKALVDVVPPEEPYLRELDALAAHQARETVSRVAKDLSVVRVLVRDDALTVLGGSASTVDAVDALALGRVH